MPQATGCKCTAKQYCSSRKCYNRKPTYKNGKSGARNTCSKDYQCEGFCRPVSPRPPVSTALSLHTYEYTSRPRTTLRLRPQPT